MLCTIWRPSPFSYKSFILILPICYKTGIFDISFYRWRHWGSEFLIQGHTTSKWESRFLSSSPNSSLRFPKCAIQLPKIFPNIHMPLCPDKERQNKSWRWAWSASFFTSKRHNYSSKLLYKTCNNTERHNHPQNHYGANVPWRLQSQESITTESTVLNTQMKIGQTMDPSYFFRNQSFGVSVDDLLSQGTTDCATSAWGGWKPLCLWVGFSCVPELL